MEQQPEIVEIDSDVTRDDSAYGDEVSIYTASLTSSALDYRNENGRRYHAYREGAYLLPNDEQEQDRLDMMHEMILTLMDRKLYLAPIATPSYTLDLGTGTGLWAIDFADRFPSAEVTGVDLSPIQPSFVPPNVRFIVDDVEAPWTYGHKFDFIHVRFLALSIKDYKGLLQRCYDYASSGGWVEFQDWSFDNISQDGSTKGTSIEQYYKVGTEAFAKAGYCVSPGPHLEGWFREIGFEDIHVKKYTIPMGIWPKDRKLKVVGAWNLEEARTGMEASAMAVLTRYDTWTPEEVRILVAKALKDAESRSVHALFDFYVVYGRKP
ncbi:methyltransferase, putative [Paecilomyces variotii No. 5]|uniref:Methyltransferase, putative n=1 Tax=Byssochlamys spectabilis (strain No. 5 / NBRC 109023) TaxID=1356009 RepID=V5I685_BYSSN|nr:methyltransferase, putative [Paecilomyces variotii No. 5]